jgi:Holliday junction resolvase-like predicted endonuclease
MATMAQAIKAYVQSVGGPVTSDQIKKAITSQYPGQWKPSTLQAHLYACAANNPKAYIHHTSAEKFLYKNTDGTFELYSEERHGPNEWAPTEGEDEVADVGDLVEASISLERDVEDHLIRNLDAIESGLKFVNRQFNTDVGRIDILAEDKSGRRVVIEVKIGDAKDSAVGQSPLPWMVRQARWKAAAWNVGGCRLPRRGAVCSDGRFESNVRMLTK